MSVKPPESAIEKQFLRWCKTRDIPCIKVGTDGWPDRMAIKPDNRVVWIEFKRTDGELRPQQRVVHRLLEKSGHRVYVCVTLEEAIEAYTEC